MKPNFYDNYGRGVDMPVNAVAYELSNGGDLVRGKPHTWTALKSHVYHELQRYRETSYISRETIDRQLDKWLEVNENK